MIKTIKNLNLLKKVEGQTVDINRDKNNLCRQEFSEELSIIETKDEIILDNLTIMNSNEEIIESPSVHIKKEHIVDIYEGFSDDIDILTTTGEIRIYRQ